MADAKRKATVHVTHKLDGKVVGRSTQHRNVYTRSTGGHYIVSLGCRETVRQRKDGSFSLVYNGKTVMAQTLHEAIHGLPGSIRGIVV